MHELALAEAVVDVALRHARGRRVGAVEVRVGHLRQVVPEALEFAFALLSDGTALSGAELVVEEVPATGICRTCGREAVLEAFPLRCASCGGSALELTGGEELLVEALQFEEQVTTEGMAHGG